MKKINIGLSMGIVALFLGCVSVAHIGKGTYEANSTFGHNYSVFDKKKVNIFLKHFKKETILKPIGKSLNYKNVIVFSSSVPSNCKKIGYVVIRDNKGLPKNKVLELVKKKAAKYGIRAISNKIYAGITNIKTEQYTLETNNPYQTISYIKMQDTLDGYKNVYKKNLDLDKKCRKTRNYFQCIRKKIIQQAPEKTILFLYAVTALECSNATLRQVRNGQTTMSINIENKVKSFFK